MEHYAHESTRAHRLKLFRHISYMHRVIPDDFSDTLFKFLRTYKQIIVVNSNE